MKKLLAPLLFLLGLHSYSQSLSRIADVELALLAVTNETDPGFDSIYALTKKDLMSYLEKKTIETVDSIKTLDIRASADGKLRTYSFSYPSGGTRGSVYTTLVQWKKSNGTYGVYALKLEAGFYEVHRLPAKNRDLYLLIGSQKANSNVYKGYAQVAQLKNDYLILDYPAFAKGASCLVYTDNVNSGNSHCIACVEYCSSCKAIKINDLGSNDAIVLNSKSGETEINTKGTLHFSLKFDGNKFVGGK